MYVKFPKKSLFVSNGNVHPIVVQIVQAFFFFFFSIWVFFHEHSRFTGQQRKGEGIYLTLLYHFHPLHRHLDISRVITAESSPLHIAGSRTRTGNLCIRVYYKDFFFKLCRMIRENMWITIAEVKFPNKSFWLNGQFLPKITQTYISGFTLTFLFKLCHVIEDNTWIKIT